MGYLQYFDDNANYFKPEEDFKMEEAFASDLTEGKYTLPIVHAIKIKKNKEIAGKLNLSSFKFHFLIFIIQQKSFDENQKILKAEDELWKS